MKQSERFYWHAVTFLSALLGIPVNNANENFKQIVQDNTFANEVLMTSKNMVFKYFQNFHFSLILPGLLLSDLINRWKTINWPHLIIR